MWFRAGISKHSEAMKQTKEKDMGWGGILIFRKQKLT